MRHLRSVDQQDADVMAQIIPLAAYASAGEETVGDRYRENIALLGIGPKPVRTCGQCDRYPATVHGVCGRCADAMWPARRLTVIPGGEAS